MLNKQSSSELSLAGQVTGSKMTLALKPPVQACLLLQTFLKVCLYNISCEMLGDRMLQV